MEIYLAHLLILIGIYAMLAMSLNLSLGFTGLFNIGHAAFFGIGAYASSLLMLSLHLPFGVSLLLGGLIAASAGVLLGMTILKLRGDYLAIATLGFGVIFEGLMRISDFTGGPRGLVGIPTPSLFGFSLDSPELYIWFVSLIAVSSYLLMRRLVRSPFGRALESIRDDEVAASTLGINTAAYKTLALGISAFFAGIAGSLYAHYLTVIDPGRFTIGESFLIISMVVIGGVASLEGAAMGALLLLILPEVLRLLPLSSVGMAALRQIFYALLILVILMERPQGIWGKRYITTRQR